MGKATDWRRNLRRRHSIRWLPLLPLSQLLTADGILWTTRCCATKRVVRGRPEDMYDSYVTRHFYRFVASHRLPFAILSDKYGLHFSDERLDGYDIHPSQLTSDVRHQLGVTVRKKARSRGFHTIVFYNNSPLMSEPYFTILACSGLGIYFTTRLPSNGNSR